MIRKPAFRPIAFALLVLAAVLAGSLPSKAEELAIVTASGASFRFTIELAVTPEERQRGLMFRESMPADHGMLFLEDQPRLQTFWMKNTLIPLDMIFIAADGEIINIAEMTTPLSTSTWRSDEPALGVLEVNGGVSRLLGIKPGDSVVHPAFSTQ